MNTETRSVGRSDSIGNPWTLFFGLGMELQQGNLGLNVVLKCLLWRFAKILVQGRSKRGGSYPRRLITVEMKVMKGILMDKSKGYNIFRLLSPNQIGEP